MNQTIEVSKKIFKEGSFSFFELPCRVDKYLTLFYTDLSRNQLQVRLDRLLINQKEAKLSQWVKEGDRIELTLKGPPPLNLEPEKIFLEVLYEDENSLLINKPQGMVVHPGANHFSGTLVNALLGRGSLDPDLLKKSFEGMDDGDEEEQEESCEISFRPGIVHRLDKETSGIILTAKNLSAHSYYADLFKTHKIKKKYLAIVKGETVLPSNTIESYLIRDRKNRMKFVSHPSKGKYALTHYRLLQKNNHYSFLEVVIETGRTHQIRVHLSNEKIPILGDPLYSRGDTRFPHATLMLHAFSLTFTPMGKEKAITLEAPLPPHFLQQMKALGFSL